LKIQKKHILPFIFGVVGILYYVLNIAFPYNSNLEIQSQSRIYPQLACGIWGILCIFTVIAGIRKIASNRYLLPLLVFLVLAYLYCLYPVRSVSENIVFALKNHFAVLFCLAAYVLLLEDRQYSSKMLLVLLGFQLIYAFCVLVMDKFIFLSGLSVLMEFDSNAGFILVSSLPLCLLIPKRNNRLIVYGLVFVACIYSGQRSAALAAILSFPFCTNYLFNRLKKKEFLIICLLVLVAIPVLVVSVDNIIQRNLVDIEKGTIESGRSEFWTFVWRDFWSGDIFSILFGNGTNSVVGVIERDYGLAIGAHNGWLDILYTFGLTGVLLYGCIIFGFVVRNFQINRLLPEYRNLYLIMFVIFIIKCSTSHGYFGLNELPFFAVVAIMESACAAKQRQS